jgi:hypothetical protein
MSCRSNPSLRPCRPPPPPHPNSFVYYRPLVVDQALLNPDPDPGFLANPEVFMTKNFKKFNNLEKKISNILINKCDIFTLGLHVGLSSYRRSLHPHQKEHPELKNMKFLNYFIFLWVILPSWFRIWLLGPD